MESDLPKHEILNQMKGAQNPHLTDFLLSPEKINKKKNNIEASDFFALFIALLQTVFLPIFILMGVLVGFALIFRFLVA